MNRTIFRHLVLISCKFFICHGNRLMSIMSINFKYVFTQQIQRHDQNLLQHVQNFYGKMWRNMVPVAKYCSLLCFVTLHISTKFIICQISSWVSPSVSRTPVFCGHVFLTHAPHLPPLAPHAPSPLLRHHLESLHQWAIHQFFRGHVSLALRGPVHLTMIHVYGGGGHGTMLLPHLVEVRIGISHALLRFILKSESN